MQFCVFSEVVHWELNLTQNNRAMKRKQKAKGHSFPQCSLFKMVAMLLGD